MKEGKEDGEGSNTKEGKGRKTKDGIKEGRKGKGMYRATSDPKSSYTRH